MKINYEKIKGKAIIPIEHYNLEELRLAFVYDEKLPITVDYIYSENIELYEKWCYFTNKMRRSQRICGEDFAIALEPRSLEGCVYGNASELVKDGYEIISLSDSLEELPNLCNILDVNLEQFLEVSGLIDIDKYSPHRITLDGVIRSNNGGCLPIKDVLSVLCRAGYITDDCNKLYDLFGLTPEDRFKIKGYMYKGLTSSNNFKELIDTCKLNHGLIYELINNPSKIQKIEEPNKTLGRKI